MPRNCLPGLNKLLRHWTLGRIRQQESHDFQLETPGDPLGPWWTLPSRLFLTHGPRHCRSVYLTFDDGPVPVLTPALLDVLRDCGVRATFFVIGEKVERYPEIVRRTVAEGHCVGNPAFITRSRIDIVPGVDRRGPTDKTLARRIAGYRCHTVPPATRQANCLEALEAVDGTADRRSLERRSQGLLM